MGREFLSVSNMLVITGYSYLNSVVHEQDFEEKYSSRSFCRNFLVHLQLSKPKKPKLEPPLLSCLLIIGESP